MIIGTLQVERSEDALERLDASARQACRGAALAGPVSLVSVAMVRIETLLYSQRRQLKSLAPDRCLQSFQIQAVQILAPKQRLNIPQDLSGEEDVERSFF